MPATVTMTGTVTAKVQVDDMNGDKYGTLKLGGFASSIIGNADMQDSLNTYLYTGVGDLYDNDSYTLVHPATITADYILEEQA